MANLYKKRLSFLPAALLLMLVLTIAPACSEKQAPPVPQEQSNLLFEIFNDLSLKRYDVVLPKLRRYREVDSTNVMIERMISQTVTNSYFVRLRKLLDKGKFAEAEELMKEMLDKNDSLDDRIQMRDFTVRLNEVNKLIAALAPVQPSAQMRRNAEALLDRAKNLPQPGRILNYAKRKIREANQLEKIEKDRRTARIYLDTLDAIENGENNKAETLTVFLSAQFQDGFSDPMVRDLTTKKRK